MKPMHRFDPQNRHRLLSEARYQQTPPERILDWLPLRPDATIADIGCGPGFFTLPLAERLTAGMVLALDIEPVMLQTVEERAAEARLTNIRTALAGEEALPVAPASLDGILFALVYHEIADRHSYLTMLRGLLKPNGWLALLEWEKRENPGGGPPLDARIPPEVTVADLAAAGWQITARHQVSEWMYLLVATAKQTTES